MYTLEHIQNIFQSHIPKHIEKYRQVSVLIALMDIDGITNVIFQKRSKAVNQSGDISFIGGHIDEGETALEAVIRETKEECNLQDCHINIFGQNDHLINSYGLFIHSFVGKISNIEFKDIVPNYEVEKLIAIPLNDIIKSPYDVYISEIDVIRDENFPYDLIANKKDYKFYKGKEITYFYKFHDYVIWGLTAKILHSFVDILMSNDNFSLK